tara:strand:- start:1169 stop:1375 length:207 start_codon:yes stop_codon:yes gene_type:complete
MLDEFLEDPGLPGSELAEDRLDDSSVEASTATSTKLLGQGCAESVGLIFWNGREDSLAELSEMGPAIL